MGACVLVVDDDDSLREIVAEAIAHAGYTVEQAANGKEALERMRGQAPCIVLLDLMMPVMDGWAVVQEMEADPSLAAVPICVVTAQNRVAPPKHTCLLNKPVSLAVLLKTVAEYCGGANERC